MAVKMHVQGDGWREDEIFRDRQEAVEHLRNQLGGIYNQPLSEYLRDLKRAGVSVTFEEA